MSEVVGSGSAHGVYKRELPSPPNQLRAFDLAHPPRKIRLRKCSTAESPELHQMLQRKAHSSPPFCWLAHISNPHRLRETDWNCLKTISLHDLRWIDR